MFDVGWTEVLLTGTAAVVLIGPEDMPAALHKFGKLVRKFRLFTSDIQQSLDRIVADAEVDELAGEINKKIMGEDEQEKTDMSS
jgi:sec-independent protein translocase protein TatB